MPELTKTELAKTELTSLARQRCFNHIQREAVAICLDCKNYFCRECITEHDNRVICANCLSNIESHTPSKKRFITLFQVCLFMGALFFLWFLFYYSGQILLKLPASFHEGTLWKDLWQNI